MPTTSYTTGRQDGAALLLMMLAVIIAMSTVLLAGINRNDLKVRQLTETQRALAEARNALIDFAVLNKDVNSLRSHSLPCPDIDASGGFLDGEAHDSACAAAGVSVMGLLPWRTLGIAPIKDGSSTCLWYVVSGSYKDAGAATAAMINTDTNGQLQVFDLDAGVVTEGLNPEDRPVAIVIAAMQPLSTQARPGLGANSDCAYGANPGNFLDTDSGSGIANSVLSGTADALDLLGMVPGVDEDHNDRLVTISRADIERRIANRDDFLANMRSLGLAAAACVADYGRNNPGGAPDRRLPWPAPVTLTDYRPDTAYDDANSGFLSGRLPDLADDSNAETGNSIARILSNCNPAAVPDWTPQQFARWQNWKDHFFFAVAESFGPMAAVPSTCTSCMNVNGGGQFAAVLLFAGTRLGSAGQVRNAPPLDLDTKGSAANYLESLNAANIPGDSVAANYVSGPATGVFNDLLFCIDDQLLVTEC